MNQFPQIIGPEYKGHWVDGEPSEKYHADSTSVSSTGIRSMLVSPKHFFYEHILGERPEESKAMRFGTIAHMAILEPERFRALYRVQPDFGDMRSSKNREKRDAWISDQPPGAVLVDHKEYDKLMRMFESILKYNGGMIPNMLRGSVYEKSGYFRDPVTGLKCRIRPDILREDLTVMPDLKTSRNCEREFFAREIWNRGYHIQLAFYCFGIQQIHGKRPDLPCFIVVENESPFDVAVYEASTTMIDRGMDSVRFALDRLKTCIDTGEWPGHQPDGAEVIELPAFTDWIE